MKKTISANRRGFTLIELLIVIAILGILALTLIAAIDPFEQLKKGRDTSGRNTVSEVYNAALRYYANQGEFTWGSSIVTAQNLNQISTDITKLQTAGELKPNFLGLLGTSNANKILVTSTAPEHIAVCFRPESKSGQTENNTQYSESGGSSTGCKSQGGLTLCYWCVQ